MITIFLVRGGDIRVMVILFVLTILGLICVFCPTFHSYHGFSSNSHRRCQMLLPKNVTSKPIKSFEECDGLGKIGLTWVEPEILEKWSKGSRSSFLRDLSDT